MSTLLHYFETGGLALLVAGVTVYAALLLYVTTCFLLDLLRGRLK